MATVRLKPGHVQPVWAGHPWVYAQAVASIEGGATAGDLVSVVDPRGNLLGRGFYSPKSAIVVRILVRDADTPVDGAFFRSRLQRAAEMRSMLALPEDGVTTGFRLVHAEGDDLPGLIVDRFGDVLVVQLLTIGMKQREGLVFEALGALFSPRAIIDRTPASVMKREGVPAGEGIVRGASIEALEFFERGLAYRLPLDLNQKTGFYFDQRALRGRVESLAKGRKVLDAYGYVGSFAMAAARGGAAEVVSVDDSAIAQEIGAECAASNGLTDRITFRKSDARRVFQEAHGNFDLTIIDPPRLAPRRGARANALVAYSKIAELGCRATEPGGLVVFCSCSAAVDLAALTRALATGAVRAGKSAQVLERHFQGPDHPVVAAFPEGLYLKALVARVFAR